MVFTTLNTVMLAADPQAEDDHRDHGKSAVPAQGAEGEPHILQQHIEPRQAPRLALLLLRLRHTPKANHRLSPRLFRGHAAAHVLFHREFQMRCYLRIQFRISLPPLKEGAHPLQPFP